MNLKEFDQIIERLEASYARVRIYGEIEQERERQIALGYTPEHDREHGGVIHLTNWTESYAIKSHNHMIREDDRASVRDALLKTATLAVAAIELLDSGSQED